MPVLLTKKLVDETVKAGIVAEVTDTRQVGLALRSGPRKAQFVFIWSPNGKKTRLPLGLAQELSIDEARELARKASDLLVQGLVPDNDWVRAQRNPIAPTMVVQRKTWTYHEAAVAYLTECVSELKAATVADYKQAINHECMKQFMHVAVRDITEERLSEALAAYQRKSGNGATEGLKRKLSPFWGWMAKAHNRSQSGVPRRLQIDLPPNRNKKTKQLRFPYPGEVARLYAMAAGGQLGWASDACKWVCITAQRRQTVVTARWQDWVDTEWRIPPVHRKTAEKRQDNRMHVIPLRFSPVITDGLGPEDYIFQAYRPRREGMELTHLSASTVTHAFQNSGCGFTPHDVRRSFATTMLIKEFSEADVRLVLDHNEKEKKTTLNLHYAHVRNMAKKREMLEIWWDLVKGASVFPMDVWTEATGIKAIVAEWDLD